MATFITGTSATAFSWTEGEDIFVLASAVRYADFQETFSETDFGFASTIRIDGTVIGSGFSAIVMRSTGIAPPDRVSVGLSGNVQQVGGQFAAVSMIGPGGQVSNAGSIGGDIGVRFGGGLFATLDNRGTIEGYVVAAVRCFDSNSVAITNTGTLTGLSGVVFADSYGQIYNDGTIRAVNASGFAIDASLGNAGLTLNNAGLVAAPAIAIRGSAFQDTITNSGTIRGDIVLGDGNDAFRGQQGRVEDVIYGGTGHDRIFSGRGDDMVNGEAGFDNLFGGAGDDMLFGGTASDTLRGDSGDDTLSGGTSPDTFVFARRHGDDTITDFVNGQDKLDFTAFHLTGFAALSAVASNRAGGLLIDLTASGGGTIFVEGFLKANFDAGDVIL